MGMKKMIVTAEKADKVDELLACGADEVVFALKDYSFSGLQEFELCEVLNRPEVSWLINRPLFTEDIAGVKEQLKKLATMSFAHIYFCDLSLVYLADEFGIKDRLIYRPETLVTGNEDASFWMTQGLASVSVSPLLTKQEILDIVSMVKGCELSVFGHQWLSISGRKLISSYYATYGKQKPMDTAFTFQELSRDYQMPIIETAHGTLTYTDYVLDSFDELVSFVQSGAERFYMDGVYVPFEAYTEAIALTKMILNGTQDASMIKAFRTKWASIGLSTGYYNEKTVL